MPTRVSRAPILQQILMNLVGNMLALQNCEIMRAGDGEEALRIILLTAKNRIPDLVEGLSSGANDYITKPFARRELIARMRTHLELAQLNESYSRFVPREFLDILKKESITDVRVGDQIQRDMSVLFADVRDFTVLSEQLGPREKFERAGSLYYEGKFKDAIRVFKTILKQNPNDGAAELYLKRAGRFFIYARNRSSRRRTNPRGLSRSMPDSRILSRR